jgi:hypothetical protein
MAIVVLDGEAQARLAVALLAFVAKLVEVLDVLCRVAVRGQAATNTECQL